MRYIYLLIYLGCVFQTVYAQDSSFTIGPVIGVDQFLSPDSPVTGPAILYPTTIRYKAGFMYGLEATYRMNRLLIDARLLATKRVYQGFTQYQFGSGPTSTTSTGAVEVAAHYVSLPVTASYLVKTIKNFQLFVGGGIVPEWINGSFARKSFSIYGNGHFIILEPEKPAKSFALGGCLQLTGQYDLDQRFVLQVQPAMYYFSKVETPFALTNNSSFRITASVGYRLHKD